MGVVYNDKRIDEIEKTLGDVNELEGESVSASIVKINASLDAQLDLKSVATPTSGKYLDVNGNEIAYTNGRVSEFVRLPSGITSVDFTDISGTSFAICFYDKNKTFISGEAYNARKNFTVYIPDNAFYCKFTIDVADQTKTTCEIIANNDRGVKATLNGIQTSTRSKWDLTEQTPNTYIKVFEYNATDDCFILIDVDSTYTSNQPTGLIIKTTYDVYNNHVSGSENEKVKVESGDIKISGVFYLPKNAILRVYEKTNGTRVSGALMYKIV